MCREKGKYFDAMCVGGGGVSCEMDTMGIECGLLTAKNVIVNILISRFLCHDFIASKQFFPLTCKLFIDFLKARGRRLYPR